MMSAAMGCTAGARQTAEGSEPETAGILLAHIDELGQALNQHYRPAQPRFSDDSDQ